MDQLMFASLFPHPLLVYDDARYMYCCCDSKQRRHIYKTLLKSILGGFVLNVGICLSRQISSILLCDFECSMIIEPRTIHTTLSCSSLAVIGSQVCTTSTVAAVDVFN